MRTVLSIANYNMHCGMDGWGRPYDYVAAIAALDADVIVLEEAWTVAGDSSGGQAAEAARHLGYQVLAHTLGEGRRIRPQPEAPPRWRARNLFAERAKALYMDGVRPVSARARGLARWQEAEQGIVGYRRAGATRAGHRVGAGRAHDHAAGRPGPAGRLVVDLTVDGRPISVAGTHMSHLHMGSHRNWAELRRQLRTAARPDAVLAGDMNTWGPLVHLFMPGWRRAVIGRSWPTWRPAQPDRPHSGAGRGAAGGGRGLPALGF